MTRNGLFAALLCAAAVTACGDDAVQDPTRPLAGSLVKFFNFGIGAPAVNFYAGDTKVTAIYTTTGVESTSGTAYGGVAAGGLYSDIAPGQYALTGRISAETDKDLPIASVTTTLVGGQAYSYYMSGLYDATTKTVDAFIVEDDLVAQPSPDSAYVRFVHAIFNAEPMALFARDRATTDETAIGDLVAYKGAGAFVAIPAGAYDLATRYAGATTNAISRTNVTFSGGRIYTVGARGDITVVSTTAANRPFLDNTANR